tara:strand:+ start:136 stop:258 length:123 start_codon:yes stop_codon:yes gene_type:complete
VELVEQDQVHQDQEMEEMVVQAVEQEDLMVLSAWVQEILQ